MRKFGTRISGSKDISKDTSKRQFFNPDVCVRTFNTTTKMPELTKYEHDQIPKASQGNTNHAIIDDCPNQELKHIEYVNKKYGKTIRNLDKMTKLFLKNDIVHGKSTIVTNKMVKPHLRGQEFDANDPSNYIYWDTCYKGLTWLRLEYICKVWGVELIEAPPYEG